MIDIHSHVIPGVDDGSQSMRESVIMLQMSMEQGFTHVIATPHLNWSLANMRDPHEIIRELRTKREELQREADRRLGSVATIRSRRLSTGARTPERNGHTIRISLGQEIQYFEELPQYLDEKKALTLAGSRYVLTEFMPDDDFMRIKRAVHNLLQASYLPVIAHIERYMCLREKGRTEELADMGAYLQINTGSLEGGVFDRRSAWCKKEIMKGVVHFLATDMHNVRIRPPRSEGAIRKLTAEKDGDELVYRLFRSNPAHIIDDRML